MNHSGLQKQVLAFYKKCLVAAKKKPNPTQAMDYVRNEFRNQPVKRSDFRHVEFLLRQGEKQLKMLSKDNAVDFYKVDVN
jgi:succinate dehydrogenase assembly factor 1